MSVLYVGLSLSLEDDIAGLMLRANRSNTNDGDDDVSVCVQEGK